SQILIALVRAAIYRLDQGEIMVSVEHDSSGVHENKIRFVIADNGRRIPPERSRYMFDGLDQEMSIQNESERTLVLARHLAMMMGGELWAEEEPRIGAVFHFHVNLRSAPMADFPQLYKTVEEIRSDRRPLKILV